MCTHIYNFTYTNVKYYRQPYAQLYVTYRNHATLPVRSTTCALSTTLNIHSHSYINSAAHSLKTFKRSLQTVCVFCKRKIKMMQFLTHLSSDFTHFLKNIFDFFRTEFIRYTKYTKSHCQHWNYRLRAPQISPIQTSKCHFDCAVI